MANIGTTTAFYKVESSLTRANNEVSKSMERLATVSRMRMRATDPLMWQCLIRSEWTCRHKGWYQGCIRCNGLP